MSRYIRILLLPFVFLGCAAGGIYWVVWTMPFGRNQVDKARLRGFFGLFADEMQPHWESLFHSWPLHPIYENLKNIGSEWARLDPQRSAKLLSAFSLLLVLGWVVSGLLP